MDSIFFGFPPLPKALEEISQLDESAYQLLRAEVEGSRAFSTAESRVVSLAQTLQMSEGEVVDILQSLDFLYDRCRDWEGDESADFQIPLRSFLKATGLWKNLGKNQENGFERLVRLVQPNPATEQKSKLRWLRTGILENAVEFATFLDLRPDFSRDRKEVRELVPVIIFRVRTQSDTERNRSHVFQLSIDGLRKMRKSIDDLDSKLDAIRTTEGLSGLLQKSDVQGEDV